MAVFKHLVDITPNKKLQMLFESMTDEKYDQVRIINNLEKIISESVSETNYYRQTLQNIGVKTLQIALPVAVGAYFASFWLAPVIAEINPNIIFAVFSSVSVIAFLNIFEIGGFTAKNNIKQDLSSLKEEVDTLSHEVLHAHEKKT